MKMGGPLLITGGSGYTGRRLVRRLVTQGETMRLLLRSTSDTSWIDGIEPAPQVVEGDLSDPSSLHEATDGVQRLIHLAHIRHTSALLSVLGHRRLNRAVLVSSLRAKSQVPCDSVAEVLEGEQAAGARSTTVILRPSMIYGPGNDRNLSRLATWLRRCRWLPVIGADGLHQPVHVDDVVDAIVNALPGTACGIYSIAGPEAISYAELVETVGDVIGVKPRVIRSPSRLTVGMARIWHGLRLPAPVSVAQIRRLLEDKQYDIEPARRDLDFSPRSLPDGLAALHCDEVEAC